MHTPALLGIDPGKRGALVLMPIEAGDAPIKSWLLESVYEGTVDFKWLVGSHDVVSIWVEKAQSMPQQNAASMFKYGRDYGRLLGWIESIGIEYHLVAPQTWTKEMHRGTDEKLPKAKSLQIARRIFPDVPLVPLGCRKPHDGIVDALLIAEYGRRMTYGYGNRKSAAS